MNYINFQLYKPMGAQTNRLHWSSQDGVDWAVVRLQLLNKTFVVYDHVTGRIYQITPDIKTLIPTGKSILITELDTLPDAATILNDYLVRDGRIVAITREEMIAHKWEELKAYRTRKVYDGCYLKSIDKWIQTDADTQMQISCLHQLMLAGANPGTIQWKMYDNTLHNMTDSLIAEVFTSILFHVQAIFTAAEYARMRLEVADDILNFDYKTGFPETYTKE